MIYLDNAATTLIKPETVYSAVLNAMKCAANAGRGGYSEASAAMNMIYDTRCRAAELFGIDNPERIVFTQNATHSLNTAIKGVLKYGSHAVITSMEHNSVLRPVFSLARKKMITYSVAPADRYGCVAAESIVNELKPSTALIVVTHASNVCGTVNDIYDIRRKTGDIPLLIDASQSAGLVKIDMKRLKKTLLAFPGHKGLYGPQGTGGLYIPEDMEVSTLTEGGTGSVSESPMQPQFLPDRFESGTLNTPGIAGLGMGIKYVSENFDEISEHEKKLTAILIEGIKKLSGARLLGYDSTEGRVGVVSAVFFDRDCVELANALGESFGVAVRGGLHCSPLAHKTLGTTLSGALRFSAGAFNTEDEAEKAVYYLKKIAE